MSEHSADDIEWRDSINEQAPYCSRCIYHWTEEPNEATPQCPTCGSKTSILPVKK